MYYWIYAIFSGFLFFLGISLIVRKNSDSYKFLGASFLLVAHMLLVTYFNLSGLMIQYPHLFKTGLLAGYLYGPTYYFFILSTVRPNFRLRKIHLVYLLPFLLYVLELGPFWISSAEEKRVFARTFNTLSKTSLLTSDWGYFSYRVNIIFQYSFAIGFTLASLHAAWPLLQQKNMVSEIVERKVLTWIKVDIYIKLISFSFILIIYLFFWTFPPSFHKFHFYFFYLSALLAALLLLLHPEVLFIGRFSFFAVEKPLSDNSSAETDYNNVFLNPTTATVVDENEFYAVLKNVFEEHFASQALDIPSLARLMHLSERSLYRRTKETFGKSPAQVLMDFRMAKAYWFIQTDPNKPIAQVAKEVGLISNGSFSSAFLEQFGLLPREFQRNCRLKGKRQP